MRAQNYISVLVYPNRSGVLDVAPERTRVITESKLETHTVEQCHRVCTVAADMLPTRAEVVARQTPIAEPEHEKSHEVKHPGEAVGQVRSAESRLLQSQDDGRPKDTGQFRLLNMADLFPEQNRRFDEIKWHGLKTARALGVADPMYSFQRHVHSTSVHRQWKRLYACAFRARLRPVVREARMWSRHPPTLLTYFL